MTPSTRKEEFGEDVEGLERQIKVKNNIIEKARIKIGEMALKKENETGKYE